MGWWNYQSPSARYTPPQAGPHKSSDGSFWVCRCKGSCGYQWNWWNKDRCHRCSLAWSGCTPDSRQPATKEEAADAWAAHTAIAAVAASNRAAAAAAADVVAVEADAAAVQEDSDDIDGMEQVIEQLKALGFTEGASVLDELGKKVDEAKARRAAAKPLWAQERDLRGKITRKQQQITKLRERSEAAKDRAKASPGGAEALDQKVVEAAGEVGALQKQLAEVARGVLLAAPCDGGATRLPPELQKLPKGLLDQLEWQHKLKVCEEELARLVQQAQEAADSLEKEAATAEGEAAAAAEAARAAAEQKQQEQLRGAAPEEEDEDMPELGEQEVVDALGSLLPSHADAGDSDAAGARKEATIETAKKLLHLMSTRSVHGAKRRPRKSIGKKGGLVGSRSEDNYQLPVETYKSTSWASMGQRVTGTEAHVVLAQEVHLQGIDIEYVSQWARVRGWRGIIEEAIPGRVQPFSSGGVAIFARDWLGLSPWPVLAEHRQHGRLVAGTLEAPGYGRVMLVSAYMISGQNLD